MSLVFTICTVWYTLSFTPAGGKVILFEGASFTIGMNGWEPGGNECATRRKFRLEGGSSSSFKASSNLFFLSELRRVFAWVLEL